MNDISISALLALVSVPITLFGVQNSFWVVHGAGALITFYIPFLIVVENANKLGIEYQSFSYTAAAVIVQFIGYFAVIYLAISLYKKYVKNT